MMKMINISDSIWVGEHSPTHFIFYNDAFAIAGANMVKFIPFQEDKYLGLRFYRNNNNCYTELIISLDNKIIGVNKWDDTKLTGIMTFIPDYK